RLVAYVVDGETPVSFDELRRYLEERLPDYMVPAAWVRLDELPHLPSGKVDRQALPAPREAEATIDAAPRGLVQEMLAGIWGQVLGRARIRSVDDFFGLGSHSLLATQLISRVRDACQVELPLRSVFEAPRLADFAARIEAERAAGLGLLFPPLEPAPRSGEPLPLSFAQQRLWFLDQLEPGSPAYN